MGKEKRYFRRYKIETPLTITFEGMSHKAVAIDYSLTGVGAVIEGDIKLPNQFLVNLNLPNHSISTYARLAWKAETTSGLKVGIEYIGSIKGSLELYQLSDLLIGLQRTEKVGTLEVQDGSVKKKIFIKNGDIIFASSNQPDDRLGDVLLQCGKITREQYDRSVEEMKKTGKKQGAVLVELGFISPKDLFAGLKVHVEKIIVELFSLRTGEFNFHEGVFPEEEVVRLHLSAANLIYKGIKNINDEDIIRSLFQSNKVVLRLSDDPLDLFQDITLTQDDKSVLALVDGSNSIEAIIDQSHLSELEIIKTLYIVSSANIVFDAGQIESSGGRAGAALDKEVQDAAREAIGEQRTHDSQSIIDTIEGLYNKLPSIGHYELLGLERAASDSDIKRAFYRMAKDYHPDKHFHLSGDMKDKLNSIFAHINNAYSVLIDQQQRGAYDGDGQGVSPELSKEQTADQKFQEGVSAMGMGMYEDAAQSFSEAAYYNDSEHKYRYYYALALGKLGRFKEAEKELRTALQNAPNKAEYLAEIGHVYLMLDLPLRAKGNFEKALQIQPENKRALKGMESLPTD